MSRDGAAAIRAAVEALLAKRGLAPVSDEEPLFSSGRLDSLAATEILMRLEEEYGIDLADEDFDIARIDTLGDLERLVGQHDAAAEARQSMPPEGGPRFPDNDMRKDKDLKPRPRI